MNLLTSVLCGQLNPWYPPDTCLLAVLFHFRPSVACIVVRERKGIELVTGSPPDNILRGTSTIRVMAVQMEVSGHLAF